MTAPGSMTTPEILAEITRLQNIQKRTGPKHPAWHEASSALAPLFAEMALRSTSTHSGRTQ